MNKIISIFILTVALSAVSFAQNFSVDSSITSIGVYPAVAEGFNTVNIETPDFNAGLYIVSLESSFGVVIRKLMVK